MLSEKQPKLWLAAVAAALPLKPDPTKGVKIKSWLGQADNCSVKLKICTEVG